LASSRTVVIAGAGIGGLTAALAIARHGYRVVLLEQAERLEADGPRHGQRAASTWPTDYVGDLAASIGNLYTARERGDFCHAHKQGRCNRLSSVHAA
jgi:2-polyprenyl-6-methoxyphenol hydroxylase-like FAD-dependent oxidoreductase